ncbi:MAG TPA: DUF4097 family beta strand repeat-containing protein [Chloroflexia bacterium]|nr:DUF4097 family beta strand repeat-containing protein [Chloroflexia bacterium]
MRRVIVPVLVVLLVLELAVAGIIVFTTPGGLGGLGFGPERRQALPAQTFNVDGNGTIVATGDVSNIEIVGQPGATTVTVQATKVVNGYSDDAFQRVNFQASQNGNDITINTTVQKAFLFNLGGGRVDLTITAPPTMVANIRHDVGNINLTNLDYSSARHNLRSSVGEIKLSQVKAERVEVKSDVGSVNLNNVTATVWAESNVGRIESHSSTLNIERVHSDTGSIDLSGTLQQTTGGSVDTNIGSITLDFGNSSNARIDATTNLGNVKMRQIEQGSYSEGKHLTSNGNGSTITVRSDIGSITIN